MNAALLTDQDLARREEVTRVGLWIFLGTVAMLFGAFTSAYVVRRSGSDWRAFPLPAILLTNTIVLVLSSAALETGWRIGRAGWWRIANAAFAVAIALGATFLAGQWLAWRELQSAGFYLPANPSSSFFYLMTGAHALHVIAALAVLAYGAVLTWRGDGRRRWRAWASSIALCRTFWHFLLGVWIYLIAFVSLF